jgi:hypothetical protein
MSNCYIVKFIQDINNLEPTTSDAIDAFIELIKDKGCPTMFIRTHEESTHPDNKNLVTLYVTKNMDKFDFLDDQRTCTFRSHKIIFDSNSSSAYSGFKNNFEESLNSKFGTEYYPNSGRLMYVGEVLCKQNEDNEANETNEDNEYTDKIKAKTKAKANSNSNTNNRSQTIKAHGIGTLYFNSEGQNVKYRGEFSKGNFDGPGKFYSQDGKVCLIAKNISNGVPVQNGKLEINYANNKQCVTVIFNDLWERLGLDNDSKELKRMKVISDKFVDDVLQVYWTNKNFTIREVKFKELSSEDKHLQLFNQINELKSSLDETKKDFKLFHQQNIKILQTLSNNMLVTVVSVTLAQILLNWYL